MTLEELKELILSKKVKEFKAALEDFEEADIATLIDELDDDYQVLAFRMLPKDNAADVFAYLPADTQEKIITHITDKEITTIIEDLYVDDAVDMLDELPATVVKRVLGNAKPETRAVLNQFLRYEESSAGSIMTAEFIDFKKTFTIKDCINKIRTTGNDKETIYTCYVTDEKRHLIGVVSVKDLLLNKDDTLIEQIMDDNVISCKTSDDQEEVSKLLQKYDYLALPVVDNEGRLVGIITIDDAVDVIQEEAEEDFEVMAAMIPSDTPYLETPVWVLYKNRIVWLFILMCSAMITGGILESKEEIISSIPLLVAFLPMINDTGGNSGSQAATLCIRGLASGEVKIKDALKVWWKEFRVSLLIAITLALFNFVRIMIFNRNSNVGDNSVLAVAAVICISLSLTIVIAKSIGGLLPIFAKLIHLDPAVCAAPMITTIVDCCAVLIYFGLASVLLNL